ncbi:MAG: hypothetical protein QME84_04235 [Actinomycetota bacterium]|nr:hypothetical protein [Actinomycetota bacterium]
MESKKIRKALSLGLASLALLALSLVASSCSKEEGGKGPAPSQSEEVQVEVADRSDVDGLLESLDQAMESVSLEDFSDSQLSDGELGL